MSYLFILTLIIGGNAIIVKVGLLSKKMDPAYLYSTQSAPFYDIIDSFGTFRVFSCLSVHFRISPCLFVSFRAFSCLFVPFRFYYCLFFDFFVSSGHFMSFRIFHVFSHLFFTYLFVSFRIFSRLFEYE